MYLKASSPICTSIETVSSSSRTDYAFVSHTESRPHCDVAITKLNSTLYTRQCKWQQYIFHSFHS